MLQALHNNTSRFAAVLLCVGLSLPQLATAQESVPFRTRNLSPMVKIFGLPTWETGLQPGDSEFALVGEVASHFRLAARGEEELILDGESWHASLFYKRNVAERWTLGLELPLIRLTGGELDDIVDGWHSLLDLPDGNRNLLPEDRLDFRYADNGTQQFALNQSGTYLGDAQLSAARTIGNDNEFLLRAVVKLPTGDEKDLAGSGATDLTVLLLRRRATMFRSRAAGYYWGLGVMRLGDPEYLATRARDWVALGVLGGSWRPFPSIGIKAQLDFHSNFYDSDLDELGKDSVQASIGGWWEIDDRRTLSLAINEDLVVRTAPDVHSDSASGGMRFSYRNDG
jgi:hypothetical protein